MPHRATAITFPNSDYVVAISLKARLVDFHPKTQPLYQRKYAIRSVACFAAYKSIAETWSGDEATHHIATVRMRWVDWGHVCTVITDCIAALLCRQKPKGHWRN